MTAERAPGDDSNLKLVEDDLNAVFKKLCPPGAARGAQSEYVQPTLRLHPEEGLQDLEASALPYVAWRCDVTFTGKMRFLGRTVHSGLRPSREDEQPSQKTVTLNGITLIRDKDGRKSFLRYIEWYPFLTELGLVAAVRPVESSQDLEGEEELLESALHARADRSQGPTDSAP